MLSEKESFPLQSSKSRGHKMSKPFYFITSGYIDEVDPDVIETTRTSKKAAIRVCKKLRKEDPSQTYKVFKVKEVG